MQSIITFAGLAFANLAVAGPCKPLPQTTVSSVDIVPTTTAEPTVVTATVVPVPGVSTSAEFSAVISESETGYESSTFVESSTLATVVIQETSTAETGAAETSAETTAEAGTTSVEVETSATQTTTETAAPTADQSCDNGGLDYAIYNHEFYNSDAPHFSSFDATYFHDATPTYQGITERIGIQPDTDWTKPFTIYEGSPNQMYQYKAVNHRGFLYAPESGIYEVTVPISDEITLVWFGDKAVNTWTRDNADLEQDYPGGTSRSFSLELQAGTYTPFRLLWANAQGELSFIAEIKAPSGNVIVNGDGADNKYLVRYSCDGNTPTFPNF
ncbi:hypothetical protein FVEN_g7808 [Fusarium venenatum]|uniref:PA14 domain-containing protein n=1 Tax=Fusarium venenatum TaxID=56646 RepID=A0A2L2TIR1_9HYPO|nr:uncharacterized protein FVRRES_07990 [Fusarium venenatum]KAG8354361.1 hypothetical protein FVEN_g7808 [Fusarium venenatum]KAH6964782.1 GLEYA domain-containing protein [Fusarium venenatum]CEI67913.1 unnamed protein product [Fusarium venenatum]